MKVLRELRVFLFALKVPLFMSTSDSLSKNWQSIDNGILIRENKMKTVEEQMQSFWKFVIKRKPEDCWEWTGTKSYNGYGLYIIQGKQLRSHRISYQSLVGEIPKNMCVCHKCDNPGCVNPDHLFLETVYGNIRDRVNKHRSARGENNGASKLTQEQVDEIRNKYIPRKYSLRKLAKEYGVVHSSIRFILVKGWLT